MHRRRARRRRVQAPDDARAVALQRGQHQLAHPHPRIRKVGVRGVLDGDHCPAFEVSHDVAPPDAQQRPHETAAPRRHPAQAGQAAPAQQVHGRAFNQVVGGVRQGDLGGGDIRRRALEKLIPQRARRGLHRAPGQWGAAPLDDQTHAEHLAEMAYMVGDERRALLQRVVVVRGHDGVALLAEGK